MKSAFRYSLLLLALLTSAVTSRGQAILTINFDDLAAFSQPAEQYASSGIHFGSGPNGVQNGLANGDSGGWAVDGTNGAFFLGFNGNPGYSETITIDKPVSVVSLDVSRTAGSSAADTFTLTAYAGATIVDTQTVTLLTINAWQKVTVTAGSPSITSLQLDGAGLGFHPYGVDNIQFQAVPEPSVPRSSAAACWVSPGCAGVAEPASAPLAPAGLVTGRLPTRTVRTRVAACGS